MPVFRANEEIQPLSESLRQLSVRHAQMIYGTNAATRRE